MDFKNRFTRILSGKKSLEKISSAHIARLVGIHTTATYLLAGGATLREVMTLMGWTRIETAQKYIHPANSAAEQMAKLPY